MRKRYQVALLLGFGALFAAFVFNPPKFSADWASWVQAFGSIGAILIAVWVSHRDNKNAVDRERVSEKNEGEQMARALASELAVHWKHYHDVAGSAIELHDTATAFRSYWMPPEHPFPMFMANAGRLHLIPSVEAQEAFVYAFSSFQTLFTAYRSNNKAMDELDSINRLICENYESANELGKTVIGRMARYSPSIFNAHNRVKSAVSVVDALVDIYNK